MFLSLSRWVGYILFIIFAGSIWVIADTHIPANFPGSLSYYRREFAAIVFCWPR